MDGAFAEYVRIPAVAIRQGNVIPISTETDPAAAALIEPLACVLHGQDVLDIQPDDVVLVIGAGPIGLMHLMLARLRGAKRVVISDLLPDRLALATRTGADRAVNPVEEDLARVLEEVSGGHGADVVIVAAPAHRAQEESVERAAIGGRINFFGGLPKDRPTIKLNSNLVHYKELSVTGTTACSTADCLRAAAIVEAGHIDLAPLVSDTFPLEQAIEAFGVAEGHESLKVVITP
jgi:L-iditol 2-dehydrogenase